MRLLLPLLAFLSVPLPAQNQWFDFLPKLKSFLQLTDGQLNTILRNNDAYNSYAQQKQSRIFQVQSEIADETAKDTLDPDAIGIRYAEIEAICRDLKDRATAARTQNRTVLSESQQAKLKVLDDALKLLPTISEAQSANFLENSAYPYGFTSSSFGYGTSGGTYGGVSGCRNNLGVIGGILAPGPVPASRAHTPHVQ